MSDATKDSNAAAQAAGCPVDHSTREVWLAQARSTEASRPGAPPQEPQSRSWGQTLLSYIPFRSKAAPSSSAPATTPSQSLGTDRVVSTIPRSSTPGPSSCPVNHEQETGSDAVTGNWIYPSEKMFFDAMKRKGHDPRATDMKTVVPIHNAVNERAWHDITEWERPYLEGTTCGGPRLHSFAGDSKRMTPKARIMTLLGYTAPFDRHDWVVDRCGKKIEYVIDFYAGRRTGQPGPSFYLDVRPKLNSWDGVKMRALRGLGLA